MSIRVNSVVTEADIQAWSWDESIKKIQGYYIGSWKHLSKELLETLYQAKMQTNNGPGNPHGRYSWKQWHHDAFWDEKGGKFLVTIETVNTWIYRYEIGEAAWKAEQDAKKEAKKTAGPIPFDNDTTLIKRKKKNKDGSITFYFSFSEYENILFEETVRV